MIKMIIDANEMILGRIATKAAKAALLGEKVDIVNCEKSVITGNKAQILARYKQRRDRGTHSTGPFFPRMPDRFVKRVVRGMLPYKQSKGRDALKRVTCHIGVPEEFNDQKMESFKEAHISKLPSNKFVFVKVICKFIGAKI